MRVFIRIAAGIILCVAGITGCFYSIRVARAQNIYYSVRYGSLTNAAPDVVLGRCRESFELYPHSYDLTVEACLKTWTKLSSENPAEVKSAVDTIQLWCDRGLAQNRYHRTLNQIKADMLSLESSGAAADYWMEFVENQFWNPVNLALLVKYYADAGRLAEASEFLSLLRGHPKYKEAAAALHKALEAEKQSF